MPAMINYILSQQHLKAR